jgi:PhnB protein
VVPAILAHERRTWRGRGHLWWLHERFEDVDPDTLASRFADPAAQQAMGYVQDSLTRELSRAD